MLGSVAILFYSCNQSPERIAEQCKSDSREYHQYALLSSRINSLEELKALLGIEYLKSDSDTIDGEVKLSYCSKLGMIYSELTSGLSQEDIMKAQKAGISEKLEVMIEEPVLVQNRKHLKDIYLLSRRRHDVYGYPDVAFYDLALEASRRIRKDATSFSFQRDSSEKGYLNTFNHITAQALITSIYSASLADKVADVHERYNMPELINGRFSANQLESLSNNPVDNYVDIINNEVGQILGEQLKNKYRITLHQQWNEKLLCQYLNDLQRFYSKAFKISLKPFNENEYVILRFCEKLNVYYKTKHKALPS